MAVTPVDIKQLETFADRMFGKVSKNTLNNVFFINKFRNTKYWLDYLQQKKIKLSRDNLNKLYVMHKEHWNA